MNATPTPPPAAPTSCRVITQDGVELFYRDWGEGRPLLFLSGWTLSSDMWAYQMAPLSKQGFRCVAYDRRAHGRSADPGGGYAFDRLADDLLAVIETLDLQGVTLVGHSFASGEMVRFLSRHGAARIARVVFLSPAATPFLLKTADNPGGIDEFHVQHAQRAWLQSFPDWIEANAEPYFTPGTSRAIIEWTARMMMQASLQAALELSNIQLRTDFRAELAQIKLPAMVIHGDRDASAPLELTGRPTAASIEGANLKIYEGGPHGLYFTHKERLNADLAQFAGGS